MPEHVFRSCRTNAKFSNRSGLHVAKNSDVSDRITINADDAVKGLNRRFRGMVADRGEPFPLTAEQFDRSNVTGDLSWPTDRQYFLPEERRDSDTALNKLNLLTLITADR